jgi:glucosamine--fructose-6-phosphate aminotransferase (isomerizing)
MCGIVAAVAHRNIVPVLLEGLRKLEYRGYDSAGLALINGAGQRPARRRPRGRTRGAGRRAPPMRPPASPTPAGPPTACPPSATPTRTSPGGLAVVHNGIIENHESLRRRPAGPRATSSSPRPTPRSSPTWCTTLVAGQVALRGRAARRWPGSSAPTPSPWSAAPNRASASSVRAAARRCCWALAMDGSGKGENFLASDTSALLQVTRQVTYLEDGDVVEIRNDGYIASPTPTAAPGPSARSSKASCRPTRWNSASTATTCRRRSSSSREAPSPTRSRWSSMRRSLSPGLFGTEAAEVFGRMKQILILACGTSYHAGLVAKYWLESIAKDAGVGRDRQRIPLSRPGGPARHPGHHHLAVGRNRRHPGRTPACQGQGTARHPVDLQRARVGH